MECWTTKTQINYSLLKAVGQVWNSFKNEVIQRVTFSSDCTMLLQGDDEGNDGMLPDFLIYKDEMYGDE